MSTHVRYLPDVTRCLLLHRLISAVGRHRVPPSSLQDERELNLAAVRAFEVELEGVAQTPVVGTALNLRALRVGRVVIGAPYRIRTERPEVDPKTLRASRCERGYSVSVRGLCIRVS